MPRKSFGSFPKISTTVENTVENIAWPDKRADLLGFCAFLWADSLDSSHFERL